MTKKLLDLYCGAGGCSTGYSNAGFEVIGVDKKPQPNYPFELIQDDVLTIDLSQFDVDVIHASPPCQKYSIGTAGWRNKGYKYVDLVGTTRELLLETAKPYIIENVVGAPLIRPIRLCGVMFGLGVTRHRLFESNIGLLEPLHIPHERPIRRKSNFDSTIVQRGQYCQVAGGGGHGRSYKFEDWKEAMDIDWMTKEELKQAIPPAYTEYIGKQLISLSCQGFKTTQESEEWI